MTWSELGSFGIQEMNPSDFLQRNSTRHLVFNCVRHVFADEKRIVVSDHEAPAIRKDEFEGNRIVIKPLHSLRVHHTGAGAGLPRPGRCGGEGLITSGRGVTACAPEGGSGGSGVAGGVKVPDLTISSTCGPSKVSYSSNFCAIISSLSRCVSIMFLARANDSSIIFFTSASIS